MMRKITINTIDDARPYAGQYVDLFWRNEPRGSGILKVGYQAIGVGEGGPSDVGSPGFSAVGFMWGDCRAGDCHIHVYSAAENPTPEPPPLTPPEPVPAARGWDLDWYEAMRDVPHDLAIGDAVTLVMTDGTRHSRTVLSMDPDGDMYVSAYVRGFRLVAAPFGVRRVERTAPDVVNRERLETLRAEAAQMAQDIAEVEAKIARDSKDAQYPLPVGHTWGTTDVDSHDMVQASDDSCAYIDDDGDLCFEEPDSEDLYCQPLAAIRALIARYDAENPPAYSVTLEEGQYMGNVDHEFKVGDRVRLTHEDGRETDHKISLDKDGDVWTSPAYPTADPDAVSCWVGRARHRRVIKVTRL